MGNFGDWLGEKTELYETGNTISARIIERSVKQAKETYTKILEQNEKDITLYQYTMINIQHTYLRMDHNKIKNICQSFI